VMMCVKISLARTVMGTVIALYNGNDQKPLRK